MIEAIQFLGKKALSEAESLVEGFVLPIREVRNQKKQHIVILNYDLEHNEIAISIDEVKENSPVDYLWIGTADGAASPQWYGTVSNVEYLLNQTIPNLLEKWDQKDPFYETLKQVIESFFIDLGSSKKSDDRYRYVVNPKFFNKELEQTDAKKAKSYIAKIFQEYIKEEIGLNIEEIAVYSLAINGKLLVKRSEYKELILKEKENVFDDAQDGICSITNNYEKVTGETTKFKFNYYINDKINFASGLEKKNYYKNMAISKTAYQQIIAGETYIIKNLDTRFGNLPCYVIPEFLYEPEDEEIPIDEWSTKISNLVKTVKTVETTERLRRDLKRDVDRYNQVLLNFLFYVKAQSSFKVSKLIKHVPMNEIHELHKKMLEIELIGQKYFGHKGNWKIGLGQIYYLIPMREQRGENYESRKILSVYESLLNRTSISYEWLIKQFNSLAKIYYFEQFNLYQIRPQNPDFGMVNAILQSQLLIKLFDSLFLLRGGEKVEKEVEIQLDNKELVSYMKELQYGEAESSMFLLGYLISDIGRRQISKPDGKKTILNKLNFQGMNKLKVQYLSIDIFEKLTQSKGALTTINEKIYSEHKRFFDQALLNWRLSDRETVFYILSGYAYGTNRILNYSKGNQQNENDVTQ